MYKMILIDVDGTLVRDDLTIPKENIRAIREAKEKGIMIVLSTGRQFISAKMYAKEVGLTDPIVSSNGAYVASHDEKDIYYEASIDKEDILSADELVKPHGFYWIFQNHDTMFAEDLDEYIATFERPHKGVPFTDRINVEKIDENYTIEDLVVDHDHEIHKGFIFLNDEKVDDIERKLKENKNISVVKPTSTIVEITHKNADKGRAALSLARAYNIKPEEIMCLGDSGNDVTMFKSVGFPIAMGNAVDKLKEIAKHITDTNENNGVAKAIDKFILKKD